MCFKNKTRDCPNIFLEFNLESKKFFSPFQETETNVIPGNLKDIILKETIEKELSEEENLLRTKEYENTPKDGNISCTADTENNEASEPETRAIHTRDKMID